MIENGGIMNYKETKREAMYRSMKYWGKKPQNIWSEIIRINTKRKDKVMDPFAGSAITFFESIALDRQPIINDINPLTSFIVDVYSSKYRYNKIEKIFKEIQKEIKNYIIYQKYFYVECKSCFKQTDIYNYRYENNKQSIAYRCKYCGNTHLESSNINFSSLQYPYDKFPHLDLNKLTTISENSKRIFGGSNFYNLWTKLNANVLLKIFDLITQLEEPYKKVFMFAFIQTTHLTSKMCAIRGKEANRLLSSSWGRPAFLALAKYMSQNPLIQLERAIYGNNGIIKALKSVEERNIKYTFSNKLSSIENVNGIVMNEDSADFKSNKVDFVITDPPYGNLINYGELSLIWNIWLKEAYNKYKIDLNSEIIINKNHTRIEYEDKMSQVFNNCYNSLKKDGIMIFTYNSSNKLDWQSLKKVLKNTNFEINNFYLQENLRTSESNVIASNTTSKSDYYIELGKEKNLFSDVNFQKLDQLILGGK